VIGDVKGVGRGGSAAATGFAGACVPPVVPGFGGIEVGGVLGVGDKRELQRAGRQRLDLEAELVQLG
jgi:hypothetical protein